MSKVISRVIIGVTPFRVLITLLITYLLSPLALQVGYWTSKGSCRTRTTLTPSSIGRTRHAGCGHETVGLPKLGFRG